ncbi:MAG TPA: NERD domain-containing protein [Bacillales bacterium]|nr:NERD domain-containing protein [Bacillales bacterium]
MAQLIKLENYVSRYELDIYRYPGQFIRMKRQRWERVKLEHERVAEAEASSGENNDFQDPPPAWLKQEFAEDVFLFQLRWASSTLQERSNLDSKYRFDSWLKFFLQRFPDNHLFMYRPIFQIRQAPVELDVVIVGPMSLWCITLLEGKNGTVYHGGSRRYWEKIENGRAQHVLSPVVSNARMSNIVTPLLPRFHGEPLRVRRVILSPLSYIEYAEAPGIIEIVDRRNAEQWYKRMRNDPSPLKSGQLQTAGELLRHCQTVSFER